MRKKIGVSAGKKQSGEAQAKFSAVGKDLESGKIAFVKETLGNFRVALEQFAEKHRDRINSDPEFRMQFHIMCKNCGVDPLASNKGFWADLLGFGDFYFELGVHIVQICSQTKSRNGGIMSLSELLDLIHESGAKSRQMTSAEDVRRAVDKLAILGSGFKLIEVGGKSLIVSVPLEMNKDHEELLSEAQDSGFVSESTMRNTYGWTTARFEMLIYPMLQEGMIWIDDYEGESRYYLPSVWEAL